MSVAHTGHDRRDNECNQMEKVTLWKSWFICTIFNWGGCTKWILNLNFVHSLLDFQADQRCQCACVLAGASMFLQIWIARETVPTSFTFMRPDSSVRKLMWFAIGQVSERFSTLRARIWLLSGMNTHVMIQIVLADQHFSAHLAWECFCFESGSVISGVFLHVFIVRVSTEKLRSADIARIARILTAIRLLVVLQTVFGDKLLSCNSLKV